jgi:ribosomal-protein-alanine N-acetyltransferase
MRGHHIDEVLEIERVSFGMPWSRDGYLRIMTNPDGLCIVADMDGKVAGYACALAIGEDAEILKLAVRPDLRGSGIAKAMNDRCLRDLKEAGCSNIYLEVRRSNRAAIKLYKGFGFAVVGVRKSYYTSPVEDALLMKLLL